LLYGKPGTGKTQLARALARDLGVTLYQVRVAGDGGLALPRHERFSSFQLCQTLLQNRADVLVLFDEVEDAFPSALLQAFGEEPRKEKGWVNRLLEDNPVPAFWLTNKVEEIDPAFIRRFDIVLEVPVPPRYVRRQMLAKEVKGLAVSERWLDRCAADPDITPADIARVARVAREISSSDPEATLTRLLDRHLLVRRGPKAPVYRLGPIDYDLSYVNVDIDLRILAEALRKRPNSNVCLYGPPGTGKTALVHWLAETLGKPLLNKRASDLLGMYVGQTEARIAAMFQEATREQAVLLLDEADSFLRDRRGASQVWEVTQVNQLLMQMEAFDGIFICSTNLIDQLDEAAFRRFAFKIEFSPLTTEQCLRLLVDTLGQLGSPVAGELDVAAAALNGATVGDFAAVARKFATLEERPGLDALVQALKQELRHRQPSRKPAGFLA
jgi:transitional endoplasmic reticulum ATPase